MFTTEDIITLAVQIEKNGEELYRDASRKVSDASLASLLEWMADEEKGHREWFCSLGEKLTVPEESGDLAKMGQELLKTAMGGGNFSLDENQLLSADTIRDLISVSMELEEDTILFYELLKSFVDDKKVMSELEKIICEEKNHKIKLNAFLNKDVIMKRIK